MAASQAPIWASRRSCGPRMPKGCSSRSPRPISGSLSAMHTANSYDNFTRIQEMSDWLEHWATTGVKPVFLCEYGAPITWDWMMYRGWYKGVRTFGNAQVPWEFCLAEWDAQFFGD